MKYIDTEKLKAEIERRRLSNRYIDTEGYENELLEIVDSLQYERPETDLLEESYMRGFAQGAKEERESLSHTMLIYAAEVFGGKTLLEDISYSYRQELADYFRDLAKSTKDGK